MVWHIAGTTPAGPSQKAISRADLQQGLRTAKRFVSHGRLSLLFLETGNPQCPVGVRANGRSWPEAARPNCAHSVSPTPMTGFARSAFRQVLISLNTSLATRNPSIAAGTPQ